MQTAYWKERGAFLSLCLMTILLNSFFGVVLAVAFLLNLRSTPLLVSEVRLVMEFTLVTIFANSLLFMGAVGVGEWKKWGMYSLGAGALLQAIVCGVYGLLVEGALMTLLMLWLLAALRHKWAFFT